MINQFVKYKKILIFYLVGIIFSIFCSFLLYENNSFKLTNTGGFINLSFSINTEFQEQIDVIKLKNNLFEKIYINVFGVDNYFDFNFPSSIGDIINILNKPNSELEISITNYMYDRFPETEFSKEYKDFYGKLEPKGKESIFLKIRGENEKDLQNYKSILTSSIHKLFVELYALNKKKLSIQKEEMNVLMNQEKKVNGFDLEDIFKNQNLNDYIKINIFFIDKYMNEMNNAFEKILSIDPIDNLEGKFYLEKNFSIFFIFPLLIIIIQSFFILMFRIINDSNK